MCVYVLLFFVVVVVVVVVLFFWGGCSRYGSKVLRRTPTFLFIVLASTHECDQSYVRRTASSIAGWLLSAYMTGGEPCINAAIASGSVPQRH